MAHRQRNIGSVAISDISEDGRHCKGLDTTRMSLVSEATVKQPGLLNALGFPKAAAGLAKNPAARATVDNSKADSSLLVGLDEGGHTCGTNTQPNGAHRAAERACRLEIFSHAGARAPRLLSAPTPGGSLTAHTGRRETVHRVGGARVTLQWPEDRQLHEFANRRVEHFFKIAPHRPLATARAAEVLFPFDVAAGTHAAVKVVSKTRARSAERVFAERKVALRMTLRHPSIVQTLDIFESPFDLFVVMEFMPGRSIAHKLAAERHPLAEAVMRDVLEALVYLHAQGVAHRNVKPKNILLDCADVPAWSDSANLADLSLAAPIGTRDPARALVGTPEFLAPEVAAVDRGPAPACARRRTCGPPA